MALTQPSGNRRAACCVFAGLFVGFDVLCGKMSGDEYFFVAAVNSAACYILLNKFKPLPFVAYVLQRFCAVSIFLNSVGYVLYEKSMSGTPYVISFMVFYALVILLFIYGGPVYGHFKRNRHDSGFYLSHDMGGYIYRETVL